MKRRIIPTLISLITINLSTAPTNATSNDYVVLESIRALNTTLTLDDDLVYELTVSTQSTFAWDPRDSNLDGYLTILLCSQEIVYLNTNPIGCNYSGKMSQYRIATIGNIVEQTVNQFKYISFTVSGKPLINRTGEYFVYMVRIPRAKISDPENYSTFYYYNRDSVLDTFFNSTGTPNVNYGQTIINVVNEIVTPSPEPDPDPEPIIESTPEPIAEETSESVAPAPRIVSAAPSTTNQTPISQQVIQSNFYLPALKGDENWKPMREIKGNFQDWKRIKKNSINGSMNQVTKSDGALITFTSAGDALTLRFLGGKKRGGFSIYVNGKFIERVDTKRNKKTQLIKTWEGLGAGKHFIDIVAELDNGQSLAINGIQRPRN